MKKIKISQLPLCSTLKGLFTMGTDKDNRSVKVSLEFIEEETNKAVAKAEAATTAAQTATTNANTATRNAQTATTNANTATANARSATTTANNAAATANSAATTANTAAANAEKTADEAAAKAKEVSEAAAQKATEAASAAQEAKENADSATDNATNATKEAEAATTAAQNATEQTIAALARIIPTGLEVVAIERITLGNSALNRIAATLTPQNTMPNIIFISDNKAVKVDPQGYVRVVGIGESEVHIIPTCNTALAKTIIIRVEAPTTRLVNTRKMFRFTEGGAIRLN